MKLILPKEIENFTKNFHSHNPSKRLKELKERCGVLIGFIKKGEIIVMEIVEIKNVADSPILFKMDPRELYNAWMKAEKSGMDIVAVFHTHPFGVAYPSKYDIDCMKDVNLPWVIAGSDGIKAYLYKDGKIIEIEVETLD